MWGRQPLALLKPKTRARGKYIDLNRKIMKKILEVLQCRDGELKFNTDLDVKKNPMEVMDLTFTAIFNMATKLWGGNEQTIIAVIRALFVADMAISVDRKKVIKGLADQSEIMGEEFMKMMKTLQEQGKVMSFSPIVQPSSSKKRN